MAILSVSWYEDYLLPTRIFISGSSLSFTSTLNAANSIASISYSAFLFMGLQDLLLVN